MNRLSVAALLVLAVVLPAGAAQTAEDPAAAQTAEEAQQEPDPETEDKQLPLSERLRRLAERQGEAEEKQLLREIERARGALERLRGALRRQVPDPETEDKLRLLVVDALLLGQVIEDEKFRWSMERRRRDLRRGEAAPGGE